MDAGHTCRDLQQGSIQRAGPDQQISQRIHHNSVACTLEQAVEPARPGHGILRPAPLSAPDVGMFHDVSMCQQLQCRHEW